MRRIVVMGAPGSGKSTLARRLSRLLGLVYIERDAHNNSEDPSDSFPIGQREGVMRAIEAASEGWILDGAPYWYEDEVYPLADTIISFDYRKTLVLWRCVRRTVGNMAAGRERPRELLNEEHPLRWAWKVHGERRNEISRLASDFGERVVVLRSAQATRSWLSRLVADVESRPKTPPN